MALEPHLATVSAPTTADAGTTAVAGGAGTSGAPSHRRPVVSRSSSRSAVGEPSQRALLAAAEAQSLKREAALTEYEAQADAQSVNIERDRWSLPTAYVALTARFGDYGLWATSHTGLDFNGVEGAPIFSVANGTVTSVGYDGSYGNKTVVTLEDGTEIWYCHQSSLMVSSGEEVRGGQQIGTIGSTGNVTGSHLHLEVRPGGGAPIDPYPVFAGKGLF